MKTGKFSKVMKWIGYFTAILALIAGLRETVRMVSDRVEAHRKIDVLLSEEAIQLQAQDYWSAWRSLEQASKINPESAKVRAAQETLAMAWLENISVSEKEKYSDIAEKLEPVLTRGVVSSKAGPRRADLLAHIGWTYFLRWLEGRGLDPAGVYAKAVEEDATNPYAHAMWGHWILWNHDKLSDARQHFASALASNRQGDYVRRLQLSALFKCYDEECDEEIIRVATAMRKEQRPVGSGARGRIFSRYYFTLRPQSARTMRFVNAVPPEEHLATFRWLFDNSDFEKSQSLLRSYYLAVLQEAAGHRDEALASYRLVRSRGVGYASTLLDAAEAGIKRLSR